MIDSENSSTSGKDINFTVSPDVNKEIVQTSIPPAESHGKPALETDFKGLMGSTAKVLKERLTTAPETIMLGPSYHIINDGKENYDMELIIATDPEKINQTHYNMLALDKDGNLVGTVIFTIEDKGYFSSASTFFNTGIRGRGISKPLIIAYSDFMQREANTRGHIIDAPILDHSQNELDMKQAAYFEDPQNSELLAELEVQLDERRRWQNSVGKRPEEFRPNGPVDTEPITDITIKEQGDSATVNTANDPKDSAVQLELLVRKIETAAE